MSLEDFATGLHFMERSECKIGPKEFKHAVKITIDIELPELITDIMYNIFDFNDDGALSYREVIGIMKSRLDRGQRNHLEQKNMSFSNCGGLASWTAARRKAAPARVLHFTNNRRMHALLHFPMKCCSR